MPACTTKFVPLALLPAPMVAIAIIILLALTTTGCSFTTLPHDVRTSITNTEHSITNANNQLRQAKNKQNDNYIQHNQGGYFGQLAIIDDASDFLPPTFSNQIQIDEQFYSLQMLAASLTDLTRIVTMLDLANTNADNPSNPCTSTRLTLQHGSLIDLLNLISVRCDLTWSYVNGKIVLSDISTKTWAIRGIPGEIQLQNKMNNNTGMQSQAGLSGGSIGAGSGGASAGGALTQATSDQSAMQNVAFNLENSLWQNLETAIRSMLSRTGKLSISPATSSLTVTDKPSVLLRVNRYIQEQNNILQKEVQVDVQVLNVDVNAEDNYGINWNLALQGQTAGFSINGQAISGGGSGFVPSQVFIPTNTTQAFTISANSGDLTNGKTPSSLIISALSSISKTSLVTSTAITTLSNQPVPVQFVDQLAYLASVQNTITAGGSGSGFSQTSLTPGELTTGFSMNILPVIQNDNKIDLQLSINLSSLKKMAQFTTQGASLQLPETLQRNFMQKVVLKSGDTFVVTGFDSDIGQILNNGVGGTKNWLFGGGVSANSTRTRMVVLITPHLINI